MSTASVGLTIFPTIFDNTTQRKMVFSSFDEFEKLLYSLSEKPGYKPKKGERVKNASPLITPAVFQAGTTRANKNVISWDGWCALDIDDYVYGQADSVIKSFERQRFVCYSSASSRKDHPKFRIVMPLTHPVPQGKIRHFWYGLNKEFNSVADPQTKDLARMYYVPAQYPGAYNFIFSHKNGPVLDPDELMGRHPYVDKTVSIDDIMARLPEEMKKKLETYKRDTLRSGKARIQWTGWRDCPFISKKLVSEYRTISGTGWYTHFYKIMTSTAVRAIRAGYPITVSEIVTLCKEIDSETGGWYKSRPMDVEAARALSFALKV